jgi:lipopolysaccharide biosynthesis protein
MKVDSISNARRVCFFAHYHHLGIVADHVLHYLGALERAGFSTVVISTAIMSDDEQAKLRDHCAALIVRENVGLDFGSWMEAFRVYDSLQAELLLLTNDSIYGPLKDLGQFINDLTSVSADFYGAVECYLRGVHLQSWFLLLRPSAYRSAAFVKLMTSDIPENISKWDLILQYEVGLTARLREAGLVYHTAYSPRDKGDLAVNRPCNPTHLLWRTLCEDYDIPFLKVELLRKNPTYVGDTRDWPTVVQPRNAALVTMIEKDLAVRGAAPKSTFLEGWRASLIHQASAFWPELYHFIRQDHKLHGRSITRTRLNLAAFYLAEKVARRVRTRVRGSARLWSS